VKGFYAQIFVAGALFIPMALYSSTVPYGVPTAKLVWLMATGQI
jgi:hypothetical protein